MVEGIRRFSKAFPDGVPGLPSQQEVKTLLARLRGFAGFKGYK